jgi:CxxC-x17-CxxC domain-containing protein
MEENIVIFGETDFRDQKRRFGIKKSDRRRHIYVIGKTGTGKTTLLENMAIQDIRTGRGVGIVDPHGEFAEKMIDFVPSHRINDVIYFNPADLDFPIAFNVMEKVDIEHRHLVASGLVGVFKKIWAESWGPRLEYVLRNAVLALLEYPGSTLLGIMRLLVDKEYRQKVVDKVKDPVVKSFWVDEFSKYRGNFEVEAISPIQNKVGQFLTNPLIRNIVGQTKSTIDMREIMDQGKILIMNLSKGLIGEDASNLLGAMMITKLQLAAMSRVGIPEEERKDFYLYVDEFQNFATESFANILSEARKYRLNLILAHQYIAQVPEVVRDAVFGNVGTTVSFRVGAADAEFLEKEFTPEFSVDDLVNLGFAQIYLKLMIDGFACRPFSAVTLPPVLKDEKSSREKIIRVSRERYGGLPRQEVEEKIARWSGVMEEEEGAKKDKKIFQSDRPGPARPPAGPTRYAFGEAMAGKPVYIDKCFECGKKVEVNFKPDGVRPVYCKDCLVKVRARATANAPRSLGGQQNGRIKRVESQPATRETGPAISLEEATQKRTQEFKPIKKPRKEPDLAGLRSVLSEVVSMTEKNEGKPPEPAEETKDLKPGEPVELQ